MALSEEVSFLDCEMSLQTTRLEKAYERALADSAHLIDEERDRVRRMEHLLLQFENDKLRAQLDTANMQVVAFKHGESDVLDRLGEAYREIDLLNQRIQSSSSEIERLQDELSTMNDTSASYQSLLSEKIHLTRDLSNLKSELDRIKTQSHSQQSSITARSEMERQLTSLEVQIEDERHAHERTKSRSMQQSAEINDLAAKAEELQGELVRQSRAKQQHEREIQQQKTEWENQRAVFEGKIETLRKQLRLTKDKLQETQQDAQQRRSNARSEGSIGPEPQSKMIPLQRPGPSAEYQREYQSAMTIATPGAVRVQGKTKKQSALPGDKSAFSITPFLNRTGAKLDSPTSSEMSKLDNEELNRVMSDNLSPSESRAHQDSGAIHSEDQLIAKRGLAKATKGKSKTQEGKLTLSEARNEMKKPTNRSGAKVPLKDADELVDHPLDPTQAKPKKRKLGAQRDRNIFEDEEEELVETRKQGRKLGVGAGQMLGASASDRAPKALGFGGFSPLKRDRKRF